MQKALSSVQFGGLKKMRFKKSRNGAWRRDYVAEALDYLKKNWKEILDSIGWLLLIGFVFSWFWFI